MQTHSMVRRGRRALAVLGLLAVGFTSYYMAQDRTPLAPPERPPAARSPQKMATLARRTARRTPTKMLRAIDLTVPPELGDFPIIVLPARQGFYELQGALDFCHALPESRAPIAILLEAGTYVGNFTLPATGTTYVIGKGGDLATTIQGAGGVNLPAVNFSPAPGPAKAELALVGLTIVGELNSAVKLYGVGIHAELSLEDCRVVTNSNIRAISVTGSGYGADEHLSLNLWETDIESMGTGIVGNTTDHFDLFCYMSLVGAEGIACDFMGTAGNTDTELILYQGSMWGDRGLRATNINHVWCGGVYLSATQLAVEFDNVGDSRIEQAEAHSETTHAVQLTNSELNMEYMRVGAGTGAYGVEALTSSEASIAYCNFGTDTDAHATHADGTSTMTRIFSHWRFWPLP